jgi:hypothetical protein
MSSELIRLIITALAIYRLSQLFSEDDGPGFIFKRLRAWTDRKAKVQQDVGQPLGFWCNLDEGLNCPFCIGIYIAVGCALLLLWGNYWADLFLLIFGLAGTQSFLQRITK